jgi:hypothetical protein
MIKRYEEYSQSYKYDKEGYSEMIKCTQNGYSIEIGIRTETCQKDIVTCYATKYAVRIGNPFIVILNHT